MRVKLSNLPLYVLGVFLLLIVAYPLYFIVIASVSDPGMVLNGEVWLFPKKLNLTGYEELFKVDRIWVGYRNTIFYAIAGTAISMLVTVPAAYATSIRSLKIRRPVMLYFMFTMFFNGGLIPTYLIISQKLHMDNSIWVMIIPFCLNVYNMIIMRTFFESSLPQELWEAAQLDGCSHAYYLVRVVMPLSKAVLSVIVLYYVVGKWNEYFMALIYIRDDSLVPLQIVLRDILIQNEALSGAEMGAAGMEASKKANLIKYASIVVATLPMMILYPFLQKYFEKGVMIGAVKG
ncbi:MAG: carbohydrate ABC transporter permease [Eubacteriales bacterium]|nr:carbohydrate ABC transporter permease [Eubacteriales bacterium]